MIWRLIESHVGAIIYKGIQDDDYPVNWGREGNIISDLKNVPYHAKCLYEPFDHEGLFKYVFTIDETIMVKRELKYVFETTSDAIDFVADFLPISMDGRAEIIEMIIGERNFAYTDLHHNLTVNFKINNSQP